MTSYHLLRREIREYIYDQGWPSLSKTQEAAISQVANSNHNLILSAPTASGKTEAAFLPAINAVNDWESGLKIIYISPLIALINDQFKRITELCHYLKIPVTAWHSEASAAKKKQLLAHPAGILLITPESLEAMLTLQPQEAQFLFKGVEWVLIDEIHGFIASNRGLHLESMLERMQHYMIDQPRYIGMSATLPREDSALIKNYFKNDVETVIIQDKTRNELQLSTDYYPIISSKYSELALEKIYSYSLIECMLIFPNSRSQVELLTVQLKEMAKKNNVDVNYFAHHSSLSKGTRTSIEQFAKHTKRGELFSICCTSTLEMGIDIGSVDSVVQYNAPHSVTSLGQRLGRSGRRTKTSILHFIATKPFELLKGLATIAVYHDGEIERFDRPIKPYDIFAHQVLALLLEHSGMTRERIIELNQTSKNFSWLERREIKGIINHLIKYSYIEDIGNELIIGKNIESLMYKGNFFAQFVTFETYTVLNDSKKIGELDFTPMIEVDQNIILGGKKWRISAVRHDSKKIIVTTANDAVPPTFFSDGGDTSHLVTQKMVTLMTDDLWIEALQPEMKIAIQSLIDDQVYPNNPYLVIEKEELAVRSFAGSKINRTIQLLLSIVDPDAKIQYYDQETLFEIKNSNNSITDLLFKVDSLDWEEEILYNFLREQPTLAIRYLSGYKYIKLLPFPLQLKYFIFNLLDIPAATEHIHIICSSLTHDNNQNS
ncbi:DEAD/DEAH box helicase [Vagococcus silagei]|uniref:DEAD/DEAH box helicase n=1 Tax=Vagococcus silagei TaxID=2508885 RepID=A0A4S3B5G9_9ENTE|nr:DEAD/DEAH box helicase [Vagococcus silagei]THB61557.1 DEAD/DEAH box helicase [Vagococcus silagei]